VGTAPDSAAVGELTRLNLLFGDWELRGQDDQAREQFNHYLDANLLFRRGDGTTASKQNFLDDLGDAENASERLDTDVTQVQVFGDQAIVVAHVYLKWRRRGNPVDGTFRNIRLFEQQDGVWRCVMWFNKRM